MAKMLIDVLRIGQGRVVTIPVGGTDVAYSHSFPLPMGISPNFTFEYKAASSGAIKLKFELEQSSRELLDS